MNPVVTAAGRKEAYMTIDFEHLFKFVQFVAALATVAEFVMKVSQHWA